MSKKTTLNNKQHIRLAAEYLVASELNRRFLNASIQIGTNVGYDIAAFDNNGHVVYLEVKGSQLGGWILGKKAQDKRGRKVFYVLVTYYRVDIGQKPEIYILPASVVAKILRRYDKLALEPKHFNNKKYREAWHSLGLIASTKYKK